MIQSSPSLLAKLAKQRQVKKQLTTRTPPTDWQPWLTTLFPGSVKAGFASHHTEFWEWVWAIQKGIPAAYILILARGGGKSTNAELANIRLGAEGLRNYAWYCSETQDQADKHLETIVETIERSKIEQYYPGFGGPRLGKVGKPKAWRRNRIWTESGFILDAIGLDTATRGARVAEDRPGLLTLDDIDGKLDSPNTTLKKIDIITHSLLPAGSSDLVVIGAQNLIHPNSVFAQLSDGRAEFLYDRIVSGPHPAIKNLVYEEKEEGGYRITEGEATWEGQNLEICETQINKWGLTSFLQEAQHEVEAPPGGMFNHLEYRRINYSDLPILVRKVIWIDPAVTSTDHSDSMGIQMDALGEDGIIYRLWSWENITSPEDVVKRAVLKAFAENCDTVGIETDQGGDTWGVIFRETIKMIRSDPDYHYLNIYNFPNPTFRQAKAGQGHGPKAHRAAQMLVDYERGKIVHVRGTHLTLEKALNRFPHSKPLDLADASYWSWLDLRRNGAVGTQINVDATKADSPTWNRSGQAAGRWGTPGKKGSRWSR